MRLFARIRSINVAAVAVLVLLPLSFLIGAELDDTWTVSVNGQTVPVGANGKFIIPNIAAADNFGPGGQGTAPDFKSDDYFCLTGVGLIDGQTRYVISERFQINQGQTFVFTDDLLTVTEFPVADAESIEIVLDPPTVEEGGTAQLAVLANLSDGTQLDVTSAALFTTYRSSYTKVATVDDNGLVAGIKPGDVIITATNCGATATRRITVLADVATTTVTGITRLSNGTPIEGALVEVRSQGVSALSDATGFFLIPDVFADAGFLTVEASVDIGGLSYFGSVSGVAPVLDGITDAGFIDLTPGPQFLLSGGSGPAGGTFTSNVLLDTDVPLSGWSFGVCHDGADLEVDSTDASLLVDTINGGAPPDLISIDTFPGAGVTMAVIIDLMVANTLAPATGNELLNITYDLLGSAGTTAEICFCDDLGTPAVANSVVEPDGDEIPPNLSECAEIAIE